MLRLCKKCSFRLKQIDADENFTTWECTNPECKEIYKFPVEKVVEEEKPKIEEEKIVINVPKFNRTFTQANENNESEEKREIILNNDTSKEEKKLVTVVKKEVEIPIVKESQSDSKINENNSFAGSTQNVDKTQNENLTKDNLKQTQQEVLENNEKNLYNIAKDDTEIDLEKSSQKIVEPQKNNKVVTEIIVDNKQTNNEKQPIKTEPQRNLQKTNQQINFNDLNDNLGNDEDDELDPWLGGAYNQGEYDPYKLDYDAEDARFPISWSEETQFTIDGVANRNFTPVKFICPQCSGTKFGVSSKITQCLDCGNRYLNLKLESEYYYGLTEAVKLRQKANFIDAQKVIQEIINRYPSEDLCDALFAKGLAESNVIFRENIKTGKKFVTIYEPSKIPFNENPNVIRALNIAKLQSSIKYKTLKKLVDEVMSASEDYETILKQNGRYTVFVCYHQGDRVQSFTKSMLKSLSKITKTFVVGKVGDIVDDNKDLLSKIFYGLNTAKIMVLLCSSKEDIMSPSVEWRYKSFLSVNREKYIIPVLMNGMRKEDLPPILQRFNAIDWNEFTLLNILKEVHRLLPNEYINQDYLEDRLNKIEDCLINERYTEAVVRADRLNQHFSENPYIYFYRLLAKNQINDEENIARIHEDLKDNVDFKMAKKYADGDESLLERLLRFEITNTRLQTLRRKEERKRKTKEKIVKFFTKPAMQYLYSAFLPLVLGILILLTKQSFINIKSIYLFTVAGAIFLSSLVLITVYNFNKKTIITLIASVLFLFGTTCLSRISFIDNNGTLYSYIVNTAEKTICITKEDSLLTNSIEGIEVQIPETVKIYGKIYKVTEIGESLFEDCYGLKSIKIPKYVTKISPYAFKNVQADIIFDEDSEMIKIDDYAFAEYKGNRIVNLPKNLKHIGNYAFENCDAMIESSYGTKEFRLPSSVITIGEYAFKGVICKVTFGDNPSITHLGDYAFADYLFTDYVSVSERNKFVLPSSLKSIGKECFLNCRILDLVIPNTVESIGIGSFKGMINLVTIKLPIVTSNSQSYSEVSIFASYFGGNEELKKLKYGLFVDVDLTKNDATELPKNAFKDCENIESINIYSKNLVSIGESAFENCINLYEVNFYTDKKYEINNTITNIKDKAFKNCVLLGEKSSTQLLFLVPESVVSIGNEVFSGCVKLTKIILPESLYDIGINAFKDIGKNLQNNNFTQVYVFKYSKMDDVSPEHRFSNLIKNNSGDLGKLLVRADLMICEELSLIMGDSFTYNYMEENTEVTITYKYDKMLEPLHNNISEELKNLPIYQTNWKRYISN